MVKTLRNGNFIVQECKSYDIVEISPQFKEMRRIKGIPGPILDNEAIRSCRHSHDENTLPWIKGNGDIALITMKDFSMREVKNFFGKTEESVIPLLCICSSNGEKAFGVSMVSQDSVRMTYFEKSSNPKYLELKDIFPKCKRLLPKSASS